MSKPTHVTTKPSRGNANHRRKNGSVTENDEHAMPVPSITKAVLHVTSHVSDRETMIAAAAYHRAEQREFAPGFEVADWLAAEMELDQRLAGEGRAY